jgi:hypothetical protein
VVRRRDRLPRPAVGEKYRAPLWGGSKGAVVHSLGRGYRLLSESNRQVKRVEFVGLHVAADLNIPVQPFLEYAVPESVHLSQADFPRATHSRHSNSRGDNDTPRSDVAHGRQNLTQRKPIVAVQPFGQFGCTLP